MGFFANFGATNLDPGRATQQVSASFTELFGQWVIADSAQGGIVVTAAIRTTP